MDRFCGDSGNGLFLSRHCCGERSEQRTLHDRVGEFALDRARSSAVHWFDPARGYARTRYEATIFQTGRMSMRS